MFGENEMLIFFVSVSVRVFVNIFVIVNVVDKERTLESVGDH